MVGIVLSTTLLGAIVTKLVDLARKLDPGNKAPKALWILLSIGFGIAIALIWQVNGMAEVNAVSHSTRLQGVAGQILTGALMGGFGSGWHELFDALSSGSKSSRARAAAAVNNPAAAKNVV